MTDTHEATPTPGPSGDLSNLPGEPGSAQHRQAARVALDALEGDPARMALIFGGDIRAPGYRQAVARRTALYDAANPDPVPGFREGLGHPEPAAQSTSPEPAPGEPAGATAIFANIGGAQRIPEADRNAMGAWLDRLGVPPDEVQQIAVQAALRAANPLGGDAAMQAEAVRTESALRTKMGGNFDATAAKVAKLFGETASPEVLDYLNRSGMGNHPVLFETLARRLS